MSLLRSLAPRAVELVRWSSSTIIPHGPGGRSSVSGISATVFGATGFLGRYVVNRLGQAGAQVVLPYRGEDDYNTRHLKPMGDLGQILLFPYNLFDYDSVKKYVRHSNVVINLIGADHDTRHFTLDDVNVSAARLIARAAKEQGVGRLIHVSAMGADDMSPSNWLRTKGLGEVAVLEEFPDATILRPSLMFGFEDRLLNRIANFKSLTHFVPLPDGGKASKQIVYVGDVAQAVVNAIDHPNKVYELAGPKAYLMKELVAYVSDLLRVPDRSIPVPSAILMFYARLLELSPLDPLATREEFWRYLFSDKPTEAGLTALGVTPTPMERIAITYLRRFRTHNVHSEIVRE